MNDYATLIAQSLLNIGAVGFSLNAPKVFKSGLIAPVYVDNRILPFHPAAWQQVINGFIALINAHALPYQAIAGIEAAGIPHSAALGYATRTPSLFVRKEAKDHGTQKQIEGGDVRGLQVILVEDMVTTGGSSLRGVAALRSAGAQVTDCLSIVSYDLPEAQENFSAAHVTLHTLTTFHDILRLAERGGLLQANDIAVIKDWFEEPHSWAARHGWEQNP